MMSVFEGGVGRLRGGRFERSKERPAERDRLEEGRDEGGEESLDILATCNREVESLMVWVLVLVLVLVFLVRMLGRFKIEMGV